MVMMLLTDLPQDTTRIITKLTFNIANNIINSSNHFWLVLSGNMPANHVGMDVSEIFGENI